MARDFKRPNKLAVISDLNVTPLIDLAFSLLIIFMITTPVIEQYNRIDLPSQDADSKQDADGSSDSPFEVIELDLQTRENLQKLIIDTKREGQGNSALRRHFWEDILMPLVGGGGELLLSI